MFASLFTGVTGLNAMETELSVISDNIANVNTTGFKGSRAIFQDLLNRGLSTSGGQVGLGVSVGDVQTIYNQGAIVYTGAATDMAIDGRGFFVVSDGDQSYYTRAGMFTVDRDGFLVDMNGLRVQGYQAEAGVLSQEISDLSFGNANTPPLATSLIEVGANLEAGSPVQVFNVADPVSTSAFSTGVAVYDSLGQSHLITVYFNSTGANAWEWHATVDGGEVTGGTPGVTEEIASGALTFTNTGALDTETTTFTNINFVGAAPAQVIDFDFGESITTDGGSGYLGTTQYAGESATYELNQDGYAAGFLERVAIESNGILTGYFSNSDSQILGQVALATFTSEDGLHRLGDNLFSETYDSGSPAIDAPQSGGRGSILAESIEMSNVDMGEELVRLISAQRGYQANTRVINTSNELLAELMALGR